MRVSMCVCVCVCDEEEAWAAVWAGGRVCAHKGVCHLAEEE